MADDIKSQRSTPVPSSGPLSGVRTTRSVGGNLSLRPHQHLVVADRTIRELKRELAETKRALQSNADDLERATTEALRIQADLTNAKKEIEASRDREGESARQWVAMSGELGEARLRIQRYERVLKRVHERAESMRERAREAGAALEGDLREMLAILELHVPDNRGDGK
jgi:chromosome segregation ATPase